MQMRFASAGYVYYGWPVDTLFRWSVFCFVTHWIVPGGIVAVIVRDI